MAKKSLSINRFDAGIVEGPNPRDIANEASVTIEGLDPTTIGALRPIGNIGGANYPSFNGIQGFLSGGAGVGLYQMANDHDGLQDYYSQKVDGTTMELMGNQIDDYNESGRETTTSTLYTFLALNTELEDANSSVLGELFLYVHRYLIDDADDGSNGWYRVGRNALLNPSEVGSTQVPDAPVLMYDFNHNETDNQDNERWPLPKDNTGADIAPNLIYRPKFYNVSGYPRMYDANKQGITYFIGHVKRGFISNNDQGYHDPSNQVNQWIIEPNYLLAPRVYGWEQDNLFVETEGSAENQEDACRWTVRIIDCYKSGSNITSVVPIGSESVDQHRIWEDYGAIRTDLYFMKDEEGGGWLKDSGALSVYCAFVYDGDQEGPLTEYEIEGYYPGWTGGSTLQDTYYSYNMKLGLAFWKSGDNAFNPAGQSTNHTQGLDANVYPSARVSGFKMYYSYGQSLSTADDDESIDDSNIYLLYEYDYDKGYRMSGNAHWNQINQYGGFEHVFQDPPQFEDFVTENNYIPGQDTSATFSTAVHAKQRTWIGNVRKRGVDYPDRVFKSPVGKPDIFPDENYIDVVGSDGDEITHLAHYDKFLMVFKKRNLYIINIEKLDEEKLEKKRIGMGVPDYKCVVETPHGIAWCNPGGVYLYDGSEFQFLLEEEGVDKVSIQSWKKLTGWDTNDINAGAPNIAYSQENDKILICTNTKPDEPSSGDLLAYHFRTKAWYIGRDAFPQSEGLGHPTVTTVKGYSTQIIQDYQNRLLMASETRNIGNTQDGYQINIKLWSESDVDDTNSIPAKGLLWRSKELDLGNLGAKKTLSKIYLTYKIGGSTSEWSGLYLFLLADGKLWATGDASILNQNHTPIQGHHTDKNHLVNPATDDLLYDGTLDISTPSAVSGVKGFAKTNGVPRTVELPMNTTVYNGSDYSLKAMMKKINSIQIVLYNPSIPVSKNKFSIDDITLIYKEHTTK